MNGKLMSPPVCAGRRVRAVSAVLALALAGIAQAGAGDARSEPDRRDTRDTHAAAGIGDSKQAPWLQPIGRETPIGSVSSLRTEYRRIVELRRSQLEPEYERRLADDGQASADAWREQTLREVIRRDRRELKARVRR